MEYKFMALEETKSATKVHGNLYLFDLFFVLIYFTVTAILGGMISDSLRIPYYIFNVFAALWLTSKSRTNKRRRNYEAMILFLRRDKKIYKPVFNDYSIDGEDTYEYEAEETIY